MSCQAVRTVHQQTQPKSWFLLAKTSTRKTSHGWNLVWASHCWAWSSGEVHGVPPKELNLNQVYTNHCLRSTAITVLDGDGFEAWHITAVSGHKNESTVKAYSVKCSPHQKEADVQQPCQSCRDWRSNPTQEIQASWDSLCPTPRSESSWRKCTCPDQLSGNPESSHGKQWWNSHEHPGHSWVPASKPQCSSSCWQPNTVPARKHPPSNGAEHCCPTTNAAKPNDATKLCWAAFQMANNYTVGNPNMPVIPKMWFPNSNVTINYNFGPQKWMENTQRNHQKWIIFVRSVIKHWRNLFAFCDLSRKKLQKWQTKWIYFCSISKQSVIKRMRNRNQDGFIYQFRVRHWNKSSNFCSKQASSSQKNNKQNIVILLRNIQWLSSAFALAPPQNIHFERFRKIYSLQKLKKATVYFFKKSQHLLYIFWLSWTFRLKTVVLAEGKGGKGHPDPPWSENTRTVGTKTFLLSLSLPPRLPRADHPHKNSVYIVTLSVSASSLSSDLWFLILPDIPGRKTRILCSRADSVFLSLSLSLSLPLYSYQWVHENTTLFCLSLTLFFLPLSLSGACPPVLLRDS